MGNLFWNMYFPDQGNYSMTPSLQEVDSLAPQFLSSSARLISSLAIFTLHLNFPKYEITHNSVNWLSALSWEDSPFNFLPSSASSWQYCFCFFFLFSHLYSTYCHKQPRCAASVLGVIEGVYPSPSFPRFSYFSLSLGSSYGNWANPRLRGTVVPSTAFQNRDYFAFCHSTQGKMLIEHMGIKWIYHHFPGQTLNFILKQILWNANIYSSNMWISIRYALLFYYPFRSNLRLFICS